ncbi:MAG: trimethylamine methyltransferase family protein [Anaerolineales bacterium]|nr:trimethylamine methyltransferase family protein [Anaerolineales bacterium]
MPFRSLKSGRLRFLDGSQLGALDQAVRTVLADVGVQVDHPPAWEVYAGAGCTIDRDRHIVRIPSDILQRGLDAAPREFTLHAPIPEHDVRVTLDDVYTVAGSSALHVLDLDGHRRPASQRDLADLTRLIDALPQAHIMHAMVVPHDLPQVGFDRRLFATILPNTTKHYYSQGAGGSSIADQVEMAAVLQGSTRAVRATPRFSLVVCFISPLVHGKEPVQEMMACAEHGIPLWLEPTNMMGATAPLSVAGSVVEHTASALAGLVLVQLLHPGHPCVLATASGSMNMHKGSYVGASPEAVLAHCATAQLAHAYGLPFQGGSGLDACLPDAQAGYERMLQAAPMALAGVNFIHLAFGMIDQLLTASYEQAVIDNEILAAAFRLAEGFEVTPETIGLDQLRTVGPGGNFLTEPYTVRHLRSFQWQPQLSTRLVWDEWQEVHGGRDMRQRANRMARQLLDQHHPALVTPEQAAELERMAIAFQRRAIDAAESTG